MCRTVLRMTSYIRRPAAVQAAIDAAGGLRKLARMLEISSPSSITSWGQIPAKRVLEIERQTGLSRHVMRPDLYPEEPA
jgi:DNA-binding transcriptional regulator YdaS (Cro superfamily)